MTPALGVGPSMPHVQEYRIAAALLAAASCAAVARAQELPTAAEISAVFTLYDAVAAAGGVAPDAQAAQPGADAAKGGRTVAGLRLNPTVQTRVENIAGSGSYNGVRREESTVSVAVPIELGGKGTARVGRPVVGSFDTFWLNQLPNAHGPEIPASADGTLALAAADADLAIADANVRLARSQRIPTVEAGPGIRRLSTTGDPVLIRSSRCQPWRPDQSGPCRR